MCCRKPCKSGVILSQPGFGAKGFSARSASGRPGLMKSWPRHFNLPSNIQNDRRPIVEQSVKKKNRIFPVDATVVSCIFFCRQHGCFWNIFHRSIQKTDVKGGFDGIAQEDGQDRQLPWTKGPPGHIDLLNNV